MDTEYPVSLAVVLQPVFYSDAPLIRIGINGCCSDHVLDQRRVFEFDFTATSTARLDIEFLNKQPWDTVPEQGLDKAVIVESVSFFGITDPKFAWAGTYSINDGAVLTQQTYLSWNGTWTLTFDVPVFTWMHRIQGLGWIYQ